MIVANGTIISIANTGSSVYRCRNRELRLNDILHAQAIKKNLLSVRKICCDNPVKVEFDDKIVCIKDRRTDEVLLTRGIKDGLYHVDLENFLRQTWRYLHLCGTAA